MTNNLIIILLIILLLFFYNSYENFDSNNNNNQNLFYKKIPNIYKTNNNLNNNTIKPDENVIQLSQLSLDSYINSDIISKKIICDNYTSQADCWENNNCEWIYKIDNGSYCNVAPIWLL